jgi:hypothetical protein
MEASVSRWELARIAVLSLAAGTGLVATEIALAMAVASLW